MTPNRLERLKHFGLIFRPWMTYGALTDRTFPTPVGEGERVWMATRRKTVASNTRDGNRKVSPAAGIVREKYVFQKRRIARFARAVQLLSYINLSFFNRT
jgi:hypothetical protein